MFRYFFALSLVAVITVAVSAENDETLNDAAEVENRSIEGKVVAKIIAKIAAGIVASCVAEAGENCAQYWKNPSGALNCAKEFFETNKGRCAAGK